jgi:hypothetical protein
MKDQTEHRVVPTIERSFLVWFPKLKDLLLITPFDS